MLYTNRQVKILKMLLELADGECLTVNWLAKQLRVSNRTIYRELKIIANDLLQYQLTLLSSNEGLMLIGDKEVKRQFYNDLVADDLLDKNARRLLLIVYLLSNDELAKLANYAYDLQVSEATISNDINEITKIFQQYYIVLKKVNKQIKIIGIEANKRKLLTRVIVQLINSDNLGVDKIVLDDNGDLIAMKNSILYRAINQDSLNLAVALSYKYFKKLNIFDTTLNYYINLIVHIMIVIERIKNGKVINQPVLGDFKDINEYSYDIAKSIIDDIVEYFQLEIIGDNEINLLALHIQASKINEHEDNTKVDQLIAQIIDNFDLEYKFYFMQDEILLAGLRSHLIPTLYRLEHQLKIENPLKDTIKKEYVKIYELVKQSCTFIPNINDDEISYLTIHFCASLERKQFQSSMRKLKIGIICINGIGISALISAKLNKIYQGIATFETISSDYVNDMKEQYDFLVTTVDVKMHNLDLVTISINLDEDDLAKINQKINNYNYTNLYTKNVIANDETKYFENINLASQKSLEIINNMQIINSDTADLATLVHSYVVDCSNKQQLIEELHARDKYGAIYLADKQMRYYHTLSDTIKHPLIRFINYQNQIIVIMLANKEAIKIEKDLLGIISSSLLEEEVIYQYIQTDNILALSNFYKNKFKQYIKEL